MSDLNSMINDKRNYQILKSNVILIINQLNSAIENLEVPVNTIKNLYNIDSVSADKGKLNSARQELMDKRNYLNNTILNEINKKITELTNDIESMG